MSTEQSEMFSQMAVALQSEREPEATVGLIVGYARSAVRCDEVGVTVSRRSKIETAAATSDLVRRADQIQQSLRQGPSLHGGEGPAYLLVHDTLTDDRWPAWAKRVAPLGLRSVLSVPLQTTERSFGALNLYSRTPGSFTTSDVAVAMTFARHASVALASSHEIFNLQIAVDSRKLMGLAQGILMERFGIGSERAFDVLRRYSQTRNVKLSVIAQQVVDERRLPVTEGEPVAPVDQRDSERPELSPITLTSVGEPPYRVIYVTGEIDIFTAPAFVQVVMAAIDAGHVQLIIDTSGTSFVDSSGLSAFVLVLKALSNHGGTLDVVGMVDRVHRLFTMAGLDQVITLHPTVGDAKRHRVPAP